MMPLPNSPPSDTRPRSPRCRQRKLWVMLTVALIAGAAGFAIWDGFRTLPAPDPERLSSEQLIETMATIDIERISDEQRIAYAQYMHDNPDHVRKLFKQMPNLPESDRRQLGHNMHSLKHVGMQQRLDQFFALTSQAEKNAFLDEMIDDMMRHHAEMERMIKDGIAPPGPPGSPGGPGSSPPGEAPPDGHGPPRPTGEHIANHLEHLPPYERAQHVKLHEAIRKRMTERGISMPEGPFGPPPG